MGGVERIEVGFPGGQRVDARVGEFTIATDQTPEHGGEGRAPQPYDLFLASIATCAGIFALKFCQTRKIPTDGLSLALEWRGNETDPASAQVLLRLTLPEGFPERYRDGIVRAMELCAVKRTIQAPPRFVTEVAQGPGPSAGGTAP
jgi:ribosomal protein S12 methylthiotransferase accessory factor